jgi:predicted dehydrogenase
MNKLRIGIIGVGTIATSKHLTTLVKYPDVEITALCDIERDRCEKANARFGLSAKIYTDYHDLCADTAVDVVHICTPNTLHATMALYAFDHGKHVHCEKPMACTYADTQTMLAAQKKAGKQLTVGLQWRFSPQCLYIRGLAQQGYFGDIYYMKSSQLRGRRLPAYGAYTSKELNGGGMLMDGGPHSIALPMYLTGNYEPASVRGVITDRMKFDTAGNDLGPWDPANFDVEDSAFALLTMKNGTVIYVENAWVINMEQSYGMQVALAGTKAGADMVGDFGTGVRLHQILNGKKTVTVPSLGGMPGTPRYDNNDYELRRWIDAIKNDGVPAIRAEEAAVVTRIIEGIYKSAQTGETVYFT